MVKTDATLLSIVKDVDFISSKRLFDGLAHRTDVVCMKRDFLFRSGSFDGEQFKAFILSAPHEVGKVLVTGHSSYPFHRAFVPLLRSKGVKHVFALNAIASRHVSPLPLGITSELSISPDHLVLGNHHLLGVAWDLEPERPDFDGSVYVNVTPGTSSATRLRLQEATHGLANVVQVSPDKSPEGRIAFLRALRRANFTPAPRGVGSDTHMLWEILYMGGIPVIQPDKRIEPLVSRLPVLVVDRWIRLADTGFLKESWDRIVSTPHQWDLLRASTWIAMISRFADNLSDDGLRYY